MTFIFKYARAYLTVFAFFFATLPCHAQVQALDDFGHTVVLAQAAQRVIALAPHAVELVDAAGGSARLVAAVDYSDYPPYALQLPRVGNHAGFDLEKIAALKPDLIVAWPLGGERQLQGLAALHIPVFRSAPRTLESIPASIEQLGILLGTSAVAQRAAQQFRMQLQNLRTQYQSRSEGKTKLRVFYQTWAQPLMTIGGQHSISEALRVCGAENIFADLKVAAPVVSAEAVLLRQPQLTLKSDDYPLLARPTPRLLEGVAQLCATLSKTRSTLQP